MQPPTPKPPDWPKRHAQFNRWIERIRSQTYSESTMMKTPGIAAFQLKAALECYYGGRWRCIWHLFKEALWLAWHAVVSSVLLWITDRMGWTKLYELPGSTKEHPLFMRHGRKCSGSPNCGNMECIEEGIPKWFRWVTRWDKRFQ